MRKELAIANGEKVSGDEAFNYFMVILYPETHLKILDYNRLLRSLNGLTTEQFLEKIGESYIIESVEEG